MDVQRCSRPRSKIDIDQAILHRPSRALADLGRNHKLGRSVNTRVDTVEAKAYENSKKTLLPLRPPHNLRPQVAVSTIYRLKQSI